MKPKIYMWGLGKYAETVFNTIITDKCVFLGVIDKNDEKKDLWKNTYPIFHINEAIEYGYDYIVVSIRRYEIIYKDIKKYKIDSQKLIFFWDTTNEQIMEQYHFIDFVRYQQIMLKEEVKRLKNQNNILQIRLENAPYEWGIYEIPKIKSAEELLRKIIVEKISLCRFGDGEFEIMRMKERPCFQKPDIELANRLKEVLNCKKENLVIAVADNFGNLDKYTEISANGIRSYMTKDTRKDIMQFIGMWSEYYDAYVTRPYYIYRDKKHADIIFQLFKTLWKNRNIILVEGNYTRNGAGNDLFKTAKSIRRILCPDQNAWNKYSEILQVVKTEAAKDDLICISLGPTATVMAYDLANYGLQAIDIGQVDNEYEWYRMHVEERMHIFGKMVSEINMDDDIEDLEDKEYLGQIICRIS